MVDASESGVALDHEQRLPAVLLRVPYGVANFFVSGRSERCVLEADMIELLESGCGLIVGMVTSQGAPLAARGWGLSVLEGGRAARILLASAQPAVLGYPSGGEAGTVIAATGANVLTLRSIQLKGPITTVEAADGHDLARMQRIATPSSTMSPWSIRFPAD